MDADDSPDIACEHTAALARPRVLVVDDLEDNRIVLGRRLARRGYDVVEAASGEEALERLHAQAFDLVLRTGAALPPGAPAPATDELWVTR